MEMRKWMALAAGAALCAGALGACSKEEAGGGAGKTTLSIAQSEDLSQRAVEILNRKCTVCHGAERFDARSFSAAEWNAVIDRMVGKGAKLSGEELDVLRHWRDDK